MLIGPTANTKDANHDTPQDSGLMPLKSSHPYRTRQRRRIAGSFLALIMLSLISTARAALGPKWLQYRLKRIAAAHLAIEATPTPPIETIDTTKSTPLKSESSPLLVVATHEGQVWTIDSTDGSIIAGFSTGPPLLVMDDHFEEGEDKSVRVSHSHIVPSMDGMLYWRQLPDTTKLVPIASIRELVDNPIQLCPNGEGQECDILTATSLGPSWFSLNSQGSLNWARARNSGKTTRAKPVPMQRTASGSSSGEDSDTDDSSSSDSTATNRKSSLLLQRQDYLVQQISTESGEQVWNITWGNLERIDFMGDDNDNNVHRSDESFHFLPSDEPMISDLPSVIFGNQGKTIVAVRTQPPKFLWKRDFISVVTGVFGIENDSWQAVNVVAENDDVENGSVGDGPSRQKMHPELPSDSEPQAEEEAERWYWFWAGGGGLGKKNKAMEQYLIPGQEDNDLIFVPRPAAHNLVRNSWYLNHLWDTPQSTGAQRFQGYLDDHAHEDQQKNQVPQNSKEQRHPHYPFQKDALYDLDSMPRLLLLPPSEPSPNDKTKTGGVFLSWSIVVAIITLMVGTLGVAYVIYNQKKRKWMATSNAEESNASSRSQDLADVTLETMSLSMINAQGRSVSGGREISNSRSKDRAQSLSREEDKIQRNSDSNIDEKISKLSLDNPVKHVLNRSSSVPILAGDHNVPSFSGHIRQSLAISSSHTREGASINQPSSPTESQAEKPVVKPSHLLVKHQSAPVDAPLLPQGGVGMIDGIPLIRYSRYRSEFRELEPLGRGGFGTVFRVANVLDGREYAVKKVSIRSSDWNSPGKEAFSQELHRVLREVKFLALLDHPNIVRYFTAWLEMEETDEGPGLDESTNANTLSRRFSSELLTSLDVPTEPTDGKSTTSRLGMKSSTSTSRATLSHLKARNATNPLGWNNNFGNFEESSASAFYPRHTMPVLPSTDEDCGFIFEERSDEEEEEDFCENQRHSYGRSVSSSEASKSEFSHSVSSSWDASFSTNRRQKNAVAANTNPEEEKKGSPEPRKRRNSTTSRHTLYIQMQLCSSKTLGDFLGDKEARKCRSGSAGSDSVDIPRALRLFLQIVQAVQHVHRQNLIHRDLKPSNCFIDDTGTVKVGDFGLSRESNDSDDNSASESVLLDGQDDGAGDNTVGVGTRSYASPEQMNGSDYDSKTDMYALGIMLFELLYPMYTGMERHLCFQKLRSSGTFPDGWLTTVADPFPTLNELVQSMLSLNPKHRPTADKVARHIQSLLEEHSVSLNISFHEGDCENVIFVRVEAMPLPDVLKIVIDLIHEAASPQPVDIVQYGMRSSTKSSNGSSQKRSILEFALASADIEPSEMSTWASAMASKLGESDHVLVARPVWHQADQSF